MPKQRKPKISLPKLACLEPLTRENQARRLLATFKRSGARAAEAPNVERLLKAGEAAKIETFSEVVEVARGDEFEAVAVDFVRMRLDDGPLSRLRDRNQLDRDDKARNLALAEAGEKYRQDFFRAGLDPLRSIDPAKEVSAAYSPKARGAARARSRRCKNFAPRARPSRKISATRWRRSSATSASRSMSDGKSALTRTPKWRAPSRCSSCAGAWPRWRDTTG
jgi:hypothetical protein